MTTYDYVAKLKTRTALCLWGSSAASATANGRVKIIFDLEQMQHLIQKMNFVICNKITHIPKPFRKKVHLL